jgi:hypothetical protein
VKIFVSCTYFEQTSSSSAGYFCTRSLQHFSCIYECLTANTVRFPQSSWQTFPVEDGTDILCRNVCQKIPLYHAQSPKRTQFWSIYHFWRDLLHLPKQHVGNDTMGTAALGAKEPGHGQQFRPCTHMSRLRHAVWRIQTKLNLLTGHRRCATVLRKSTVPSEIGELYFEKLHCFSEIA